MTLRNRDKILNTVTKNSSEFGCPKLPKEQKTQKVHLCPKRSSLCNQNDVLSCVSAKGTKVKSKKETTGEKSRFGKFSEGQQTTIEKNESFLTASTWLTEQEYC